MSLNLTIEINDCRKAFAGYDVDKEKAVENTKFITDKAAEQKQLVCGMHHRSPRVQVREGFRLVPALWEEYMDLAD